MSIFNRYKEGLKGASKSENTDSQRISLPPTSAPSNWEKQQLQETLPSSPTSNSGSSVTYSIDDAIKLIRSLPEEDKNTMQIVKRTLESTHIVISDLIEDAARKESQLEKRATKLQIEIEELQSKIDRRKEEIFAMQERLRDTAKIKEKLIQATENDRPAKEIAKEVKHNQIKESAGTAHSSTDTTTKTSAQGSVTG